MLKNFDIHFKLKRRTQADSQAREDEYDSTLVSNPSNGASQLIILSHLNPL